MAARWYASHTNIGGPTAANAITTAPTLRKKA
jgi:hypothetical protein